MMEMQMRQDAERQRLQMEMQSKFEGLQATLLKSAMDSQRTVYETQLKSIQDKIETMNQSGGLHGFVKSIDDIKKLTEALNTGNQMPPEAQAAIEQSRNMLQLEAQKANLDYKRWEEERKAQAATMQTLIQTGAAVAQPLLARFMEAAMARAMQQPPALPPGQPQGPPTINPVQPRPAPTPALPSPYEVPPGAAALPVTQWGPKPAEIVGLPPQASQPSPGMPDLATFKRPVGQKEWVITCGKCGNQFKCFEGADAHVCDQCGTVHRPE